MQSHTEHIFAALLVVALVACGGECNPQKAAELAAGPTAKCIATSAEAACIRGGAVLWCTLDGAFSFTARCFEIGTLTSERVR